LHPEEIERGGWFAPGTVNRWMKERPQEFASALLAIWPKVLAETANPKAEGRNPTEGRSLGPEST
jgi:hypothetical protein